MSIEIVMVEAVTEDQGVVRISRRPEPDAGEKTFVIYTGEKEGQTFKLKELYALDDRNDAMTYFLTSILEKVRDVFGGSYNERRRD